MMNTSYRYPFKGTVSEENKRNNEKRFTRTFELFHFGSYRVLNTKNGKAVQKISDECEKHGQTELKLNSVKAWTTFKVG